MPNFIDKKIIFKTVTIGLSVLIGIVAILIFSGKFPGIESPAAKNTNKPTLEVWGTLPDSIFRDALTSYSTLGLKPLSVNYISYNENEIGTKLVEASALGQGPDLIIAPYNKILTVNAMVGIMPYNYMTELDFKSIYVDATHILTTPYGVSMYPILVDPAIMLYNKKILSENGFAYPPKYWTDLPAYGQKLTYLDAENKPQQSAFGIGANNVMNQKHILYTQLLQLGISPAKYVSGNIFADVGMGQTTFDDPTPNLVKMLRFQASFSDPQKTSFTWSETDISDIDKFISGSLAIYFAKSSDINYILSKNPTLEMGMYFMPQMQDAAFQTVSGDMTGVAMGRFTKDIPYTVETAQVFSGADFSRSLSLATGQAGARRDVLYGTDGSERAEVVGRSTLITKIIYDNNYQQINNIIYMLYENILSGRKTIDAAAEKFSTDWISLFSAR